MNDEPRAGSLAPLIQQDITGFSGGTFDVKLLDGYDDDLPLMRAEYPALRSVTVERQLLSRNPAEAATPTQPASPPAPAMVVPSAPAVATPVPTLPAAAPPAAAPPRRLRFVASFGYEYGFEDLLNVRYTDGSTDRIAANGGWVVSAGAAWLLVPSGEYELRATAGVKYDGVTGSNGSAYYVAFPTELLAGWNAGRLRLSAGPSLSLAPRVRGSRVLADVDRDPQSSFGIVGQADWVFPFRRAAAGSLSLGLRYLWLNVQTSTGGRAVGASALGLAAGVSL